jgi:type II restriction/modification system DNA methylase subunit YeeA
VKPIRAENKRAVYRDRWWVHAEYRGEMRSSLASCERFIVTPTIAKFRLFAWMSQPTLPDHALIVFARNDDFFFGILHSRIHEVWALAQGTQLEDRPRYTPTTCFETFPFPWAPGTPPNQLDPLRAGRHAAISAAAANLNKLCSEWQGDRSDPQRTLTKLYNVRPAWLTNAHATLDAAVATAYDWQPDISDAEILTRLLHLNSTRPPAG